MVRLVDFDPDGKPIIDNSWWALPEWSDMRQLLGSADFGLIIVLLNSYRSPYNRYPYDERRKRVVEDFHKKGWYKAGSIRPTEKHLATPTFGAAENLFRKLQHDPKWERFIALEDKIGEFTVAIANTKLVENEESEGNLVKSNTLKALLQTQTLFSDEYEALRIELFRLGQDKKGGVRQAKARDLFNQIEQ